ncbi:PxORF25 peptide [Plutella xylostella granulovirus]|uniref:ORF25 protein n=1 Tax=Plutella xylostella granulovirus TaxID=98383 RepID=Q9DW06_9BBAC|nr:PxORF25 peptide [Plutella xylostella granulovirus]AAG27323.1 PxORF25 peptide [Plutella xylostella granulovirus]AMQ35637.1 PxGV-Corf25 protein [Plutella xylostella granulovirus]AMQ35754.1 PxGV-Korf25 protein [Plutella xylostella granulovirus]AMQ35871.1 PxGV-Morf25 protein [Plutella xylostella granulovirus]AMQ35988.1 PxGV-Torf25 protein [Plutella xylostella granulovirus]
MDIVKEFALPEMVENIITTPPHVSNSCRVSSPRVEETLHIWNEVHSPLWESPTNMEELAVIPESLLMTESKRRTSLALERSPSIERFSLPSSPVRTPPTPTRSSPEREEEPMMSPVRSPPPMMSPMKSPVPVEEPTPVEELPVPVEEIIGLPVRSPSREPSPRSSISRSSPLRSSPVRESSPGFAPQSFKVREVSPTQNSRKRLRTPSPVSSFTSSRPSRSRSPSPRLKKKGLSAIMSKLRSPKKPRRKSKEAFTIETLSFAMGECIQKLDQEDYEEANDMLKQLKKKVDEYSIIRKVYTYTKNSSTMQLDNYVHVYCGNGVLGFYNNSFKIGKPMDNMHLVFSAFCGQKKDNKSLALIKGMKVAAKKYLFTQKGVTKRYLRVWKRHTMEALKIMHQYCVDNNFEIVFEQLHNMENFIQEFGDTEFDVDIM